MWRTRILMAQTLFYLAGTVALILLMVFGYQNNERMQREYERNAIRHERILKDHVSELKELETSRAAHDQRMLDRGNGH